MLAETQMRSPFILVVLLLAISFSLATASKEEESHQACMADKSGAVPDKSSWPELQGQSKEQAEEVLKKEAPGSSLVFVPNGSAVTMDYREDRIRVFLKDDVVVGVPNRG